MPSLFGIGNDQKFFELVINIISIYIRMKYEMYKHDP